MKRSVGVDGSLADELLRHAGWLRRLARGLLGQDTLAEDALQETWLAALRFPPRFDRPLAPWLRAVVRNQVLNRRRGDSRRQALEAAAPGGPQPLSPEELLGRVELQTLLVKLVTELAEPYRQILLLRYFEGMTSREIATQMHLPPATVRGRLRTGLGELREALTRHHGGRQTWLAAVGQLVAGPRPPGADARCPPGSAAGRGPVTEASTPNRQTGLGTSVGRPVLMLALAVAATATLSGLLLRAGAPATASSAGPLPAAPPPLATPARPTPWPPAPDPAPGVLTPEPAAGQGSVGRSPQAAAPADDPAIVGFATIVGPLPAPQPPEPRTDGFCARWPSGEGPLVVNREGRVANVVVRVVSGWTGPPVLPAQPAHFEQRGCRYHPRVLVAQVGQVVTVANHDEIGHQVRAVQGDTPLLSHRQPFRAPEVGWRAERVGQIVRFGCDDHPGMVGHVVVADSPWWAITDPEGRFELAGLPAGTYRLEAWHERLGVRQAEVTVPSAAARAVSFEFGEPEPRAPSWDLCAIAVEGSSPVVEACRREGRKGAKKLMKAMVAVARKAGRRLQCDGCHRGDDDYVLRADARRHFAELVALTGSTGGRR